MVIIIMWLSYQATLQVLPIRLSIPYSLLTQKLKGVEKPKMVCTFPRAVVTSMSIVSWNG